MSLFAVNGYIIFYCHNKGNIGDKPKKKEWQITESLYSMLASLAASAEA